MYECRRCGGDGYQRWDDSGETGEDLCYHCSGTGIVDDEIDYTDRLFDVAKTLAYNYEVEYRKYCDTDPDGDGYSLHAAENMMSESDYFTMRVYDRTCMYAEVLVKKSLEERNVLIAWNEL